MQPLAWCGRLGKFVPHSATAARVTHVSELRPNVKIQVVHVRFPQKRPWSSEFGCGGVTVPTCKPSKEIKNGHLPSLWSSCRLLLAQSGRHDPLRQCPLLG